MKKSMTKIMTLALTLVITLMTVSTTASADISPQQKLMARRAAEADAYRKLAARIMGMKVSSNTTVRDFATESDVVSAKLNHFVRGVRIPDDKVVFYDDGSCEVVAEVTVEKIITTLKKICDESYDGDRFVTKNFDEMTRQIEQKVYSEIGCGAAADTTQMPDPVTLDYIAANSSGKSISLPSIYRAKGARARLMAKRAAELDAYRKLIERVYGLQLDSISTVRDLMEVSDEIRLATQAELKGVRTGTICYQPDGIVQVQMSITLEQVKKIIKKVIDEKYDGKRWTTSHADSFTRETSRKVITVIGMGALDTGGPRRTSKPIGKSGVTRHTEVEIVETTTVIVLD